MSVIGDRYSYHGYKMPELVFWNVNATSKQFPMSIDDRGFLNVSGFSPSIFKNLIGSGYQSPLDLMRDVLEDERYRDIKA